MHKMKRYIKITLLPGVLFFALSGKIHAGSRNDSIITFLSNNYTEITCSLPVDNNPEFFIKTICKIYRGKKEALSVVLDYDRKRSSSLLILSENRINKVRIDSTFYDGNAHLLFSLVIDPGKKNLDIKRADYPEIKTDIQRPEDGKYTIRNTSRELNSLLNINDTQIREEKGYIEITLIILIILADIIIFFVLHYRNKLKKKREKEQKGIVIDNKKALPENLNSISQAIYLFGDFNLFDKENNDLSNKMSPILKELFLLLLTRSPYNGISSPELKEILWYDKTEQSAKNNRAVYFNKLRGIIRHLGQYELSNKTGGWKIEFEEAYVDYYEFVKIISKPRITETEIHILLNITSKGSLLPDHNWEWLDDVKAAVSDAVITILTNYLVHLSPKENPGIIESICNSLFIFDPLNEVALVYKCQYYNLVNKPYLSKKLYNSFCREYKQTYGEEFTKSFSDIKIENPLIS